MVFNIRELWLLQEPLVVELRRMNDEGAAFKGSDAFQQQYSSITLQVKGVNEEVSDPSTTSFLMQFFQFF